MSKDKKNTFSDDFMEDLSKAQKNRLTHMYDDFFGSGANTDLTEEKVKQDIEKMFNDCADDKSDGKTGDLPEINAEDNAAGKSGEPESKTDEPVSIEIEVGDNNAPAEQAEGGTETQTEAAAEQKEEEPEEDPMETLNNLIGLTKIKEDVKELMDFVTVQKARKDAGLKDVPVSLHLVFTGNPGTGKTTVARIIAKLYKKIGVLSQGQLIEVDRSGLVAGYVGQTAIKTQQQIQKAMGGVLFIDEAYALSAKDDTFGQEAIETILKAMEDHRDELVVIVAGYTEPMEKFINSNPGLRSRFNKYIEFPDYTTDELMGIFDMNCKKYDYVADEDMRAHVRDLLVLKQMKEPENFANAREVRNLFEDIITNQATRVALIENPTDDDMMRLTNEDLPIEVPEQADPQMPSSEDSSTCPDDAAAESEQENQ